MRRQFHTALTLVLVCVVAGCTSCGGGGSAAPPAPTRPAFDAAAAFADLARQVAFGPRSPGSDGHAQCLAWIIAQLTPLADRVVQQPFTASTSFGGPYAFTNVLAIFGEGQPGAPWMIGAHWDTRPVADEDPDPANRSLPVPGANDGASGVAALLELARAMKRTAPPRPVILAFFDAEDSGVSGSGARFQGYCIGSAHMAANWPRDLPRPFNIIVVDLIGGVAKHNPRVGTPNGSNDRFDLPQEAYSRMSAPDLMDEIWGAAARLGHAAFEARPGRVIVDDHLPFIEAGYRAINIIDFPFPNWHTVDDTPEYCSPDALFQVGDTLLEVLYSDRVPAGRR